MLGFSDTVQSIQARSRRTRGPGQVWVLFRQTGHLVVIYQDVLNKPEFIIIYKHLDLHEGSLPWRSARRSCFLPEQTSQVLHPVIQPQDGDISFIFFTVICKRTKGKSSLLWVKRFRETKTLRFTPTSSLASVCRKSQVIKNRKRCLWWWAVTRS